MNGSSVLKLRSRQNGLLILGLALLATAVGAVRTVERSTGPLPAFLSVTVAFGLVELRRVSIRFGREAIVCRFMEVPLCFGLVLLAPWQLLLARIVGSGSVLCWRQRKTPSKAAFNVGFFAFETGLVGTMNAAWFHESGRLGTLIAMSLVAVVCSFILEFALRIAGQRVARSESIRSASIAFAISFVSMLTGLVLVAAWQEWPLAVVAILPFAALFLLSWRGEIERSRKADALAALSTLTAELTATTPGPNSIAESLLRVAELAKARQVAIYTNGMVFRRVEDEQTQTQAIGTELSTLAPNRLPVEAQLRLLGSQNQIATRHASFQAGSRGVGWLVLGDPVGGTEFNAETDSIVETVADRIGAWFANAALIDDLRAEVDEREYLAFHDPLTDLANRRRFRDVFDETIETGAAGGLLVLALDHFSLINDSVGHQQGDEALTAIAGRIRDSSPEGALVARLGGDEFAVLVPSLETRPLSPRQRDAFASASLRLDQFHMAEIAADLLRSVSEPPLLLAGMSFSMTASVGIATFPADGSEASELLRQSDQALQSAKAQRNGFALYSAERHGKDHDQVTLLGELRRALTNDEIILHYQPKIDLPAGGQLVGAEALVRWNHPTRGLVFPDAFIPVAEHYDLLNDMFFYVVERSLLQLRQWTSEGLPALGVAVNLSARNLRAPNLTRRISRLVESYGIDAGRLTLELTETALMVDADHAMKTLRSLRDECGVEIAVDDFGVGLSSIAYLRDLPASEVKIDKTFCEGLPGDLANEAIVRAIHQLATRLGKKVCVEGVETEATYEFFRQVGVDRVQGYWIARPMEADALLGWWTQEQARLRARPRSVIAATG